MRVRTFYPEIEPYDSGWLEVGDGQRIYWETSGNPDGKPAVFLHGGPGGGTSADQRRVFDPAAYRIVLFDQRGCGQSTPHAGDPATDLSVNTTWHLVADMERLREHLAIDAWQVFGGSWGSTLALAYAQTHPDRVTELVLRGIFTLRRNELEFYYQGGAGFLFPAEWQTVLDQLTEPERADVLHAYHRRLADPDPAVWQPAAIAWSTWEGATSRLHQDPDKIAHYAEPTFAAAFARIETHYFVNGGFYADGQLIRDADKLAGIPTVLVQGRYDVVTPLVTAWELHRALPGSELIIVPDAGHAFNEPGTLHHLIEATDRFRR
ncbi:MULTISPECIES: prolyl aminopeptidase [unclassified Crossiella]|uniref:prolyl aminopeptidase n=1 Tax=unclassified Crossiella TaxID=2620835 RepID=UPI0027E4C979|nr:MULTISPECIES: prolyl aminopeptidase [unclassified Crossiella]